MYPRLMSRSRVVTRPVLVSYHYSVCRVTSPCHVLLSRSSVMSVADVAGGEREEGEAEGAEPAGGQEMSREEASRAVHLR